MEPFGFEKLDIYQLSLQVSDVVWDSAKEWDYLAQQTVGKQFIKAADSIGANIAEGLGKGSHAENRRFSKIARGSLFEAWHWFTRAQRRGLLTDESEASLKRLIGELAPRLSAYIQSIERRMYPKNAK